jgi:hypothetical protein
MADPAEIAYYVCCGPAASRLKDLVRVAAARWAVEECFQTAKGECGLDQLPGPALPGLVPAHHLVDGRTRLPGSRPSRRSNKRGSADGEQELIPLSVPEIRRLMGHLVKTRHESNEHHLRWSRFRRPSQARARRSHYKRRGQIPQMRLQY